MNIHDATEQAYKNGFEAGKKHSREELKKVYAKGIMRGYELAEEDICGIVQGKWHDVNDVTIRRWFWRLKTKRFGKDYGQKWLGYMGDMPTKRSGKNDKDL